MPFEIPGLSAFAAKLIGIGLVVALLGFCVWKVAHTFDQVKTLQAQHAADAGQIRTGNTYRAAETKQADLAIDATDHDATAQARIVASTHHAIEKVHEHVHPPTAAAECVRYGFVRVLVARILAVDDPAQLPLPAGATDDSCAPITFADLAQRIVGTIGVAQQNAQQLNDLEAYDRGQHDVIDQLLRDSAAGVTPKP